MLPRPATGGEITEALRRTAESLGLRFEENAAFHYEPGSLKRVPENYAPRLREIIPQQTGRVIKKTREVTETEFRIRSTEEDPLDATREYEAIDVTIFSLYDFYYFGWHQNCSKISQTDHSHFQIVQPLSSVSSLRSMKSSAR